MKTASLLLTLGECLTTPDAIRCASMTRSPYHIEEQLSDAITEFQKQSSNSFQSINEELPELFEDNIIIYMTHFFKHFLLMIIQHFIIALYADNSCDDFKPFAQQFDLY
ncbi:unnamed protein product [Rotaria sp. Silwood2]|nr:unnamed protein product [Rotaria sp. Silwood2]CAF3090666.1 unnamed protein product [Rotaria sp. Silwood2]CAF3308318.1 unnamed protein product [Rotaria sp. Silwood2]CAF3386482.1 unnamed protein product [Rotaria sp. Silwood2]CAF4209764.1 unnamed protein product [Rotaria sp. Silwood2]